MKNLNKILKACFAVPTTLLPAASIVCCNNSNVCVITFNSLGGSAVAEQQIIKGSKIVQPQDPTYGKYIFSGWYEDDKFNYKFDFNQPVYSNTILYAKWDVFDGKVTQDIWEEAIDKITIPTQQRNYKLTATRKESSHVQNDEFITDGYFESVTYPDEKHTMADEVVPGYTWGYCYTSIDSKPTKQFQSDVESVSSNPSTPSGQVLNFLKTLGKKQKYSFDSGNWIFDDETEAYYGRMQSFVLFDVKIKFNALHQIQNFELWSGTGLSETSYNAVFDYTPQKIEISQDVKINEPFIYYQNDYAPTGITFDHSAYETKPFTTQKISVKVKSAAEASTTFKVAVSNTDVEEKIGEQTILSSTVTLEPGETKIIEFDFTKVTVPYWKDVKFLASTKHLFILPEA